MRSLLLLFLLLLNVCLFGQSSKDSLYANWKNADLHDTIRFQSFKNFIWQNYLFSYPDTAAILAREQLAYALERKNLKYQGDAYNTIGITWYFRSELDSAIANYTLGLEAIKRSGKIKNAAALLNNMGTCEMERGNYIGALEVFNQSLKIEELYHNDLGAGNCLTNIGVIYYRMGDMERSKNFYLRADACYQKVGNTFNRSNVLNNLGVIAVETGNYPEALRYHGECYEIRLANNDLHGLGVTYNNLGLAYLKMHELDSAWDYFSKAIVQMEAVGNMSAAASAYNNKGSVLYARNNFAGAIPFALKSLEMAREHNALAEQMDATETLYMAYAGKGDYKNAYEMFTLYTQLSDSIASEENKEELIRQEYKSEYEKMAVADSLQALEAKKLQDAELETVKAKNKQRAQFSVFVTIGLVAALIFGIIIYKRLRITREQKAIIEEQKATVTHAYDQLEEKNKEILDSITYAKRIQSAILPSQKTIKEALPESFILYKPKDIVAGDFYWIEPTASANGTKYLLFAAADCTGHGVPGAMVSVVCNNALNRSVREFGLTNPAAILDKTREIVISEFEKSDENVKDGMDISLCALSMETKVLRWAGANNPLWILRADQGLVEEIKPNKQPIGKFADATAFTEHAVELKSGDTIYIFTDGFQDQFGGEKGKKFKASSLRELILEIHRQPMEVQLQSLRDAFENWRGGLEQIDDVCIIGVRV